MAAARPRADDPDDVVLALAALGPRAACSDAERRAARLLAARLRALGRRPRTETHWVRPQWPAVALVHALLGVAGAAVSATAPVPGLVVLAIAAVSALAEAGGRGRLLGALWPRRATQDVVAPPPDAAAPVTVVLVAATDAPRVASPPTRGLARLDARLAAALRGRWPHPPALLAVALALLAVLAALRVVLDGPAWVGAAQLAPAVLCLVAVAALADLALAGAGPGANADGSAVAAALAAVERLDARPPRRVDVALVLAGAGDGPALGARAYVDARRRSVPPEAVAVVEVRPCGAGELACWTHDGPLWPLALHPRLVGLARALPEVRSVRGRGAGAAHAARRRRWPAVALGRVAPDGTVPGRRDPGDVPDALEPGAVTATADALVALVRALDRDLLSARR